MESVRATSDEDEDAGEVVLTFDDGLLGFPNARHFVLVDIVEDGAFQLLRSLEIEGLEMVVGHPWLFFPDYAPDIPDEDLERLGIESSEDVLLFCSVTLPEDEDATPTMNLLGPFVVNRHTLAGRQVVLQEEELHPVRAPLEFA